MEGIFYYNEVAIVASSLKLVPLERIVQTAPSLNTHKITHIYMSLEIILMCGQHSKNDYKNSIILCGPQRN